MKNKLLKSRKKINAIDRKMSKLFVKRMNEVEEVAKYKNDNSIDVLDRSRETEVISKNTALIESPIYKEYYKKFINHVMSLSKERQTEYITSIRESINSSETAEYTALKVNLAENSYPIIIGKNLISKADKHFNLDRKVFIVTDDGVPDIYAKTIADLCKNSFIKTIKSGERSKSFSVLEDLLISMSEFCLNRDDCVVAVGGGVVGDLTGFAASIYMRGVDFYNVPTTLLSQVDSSIGGKTAINLGDIKNSVGSFKQPKAVIIDTDTLTTLPIRHMRNGICEAIKMAATFNEDLFKIFERSTENEIYNNIEEIIYEALKIKKSVVEKDEKENGLRKALNFGHTFGHAIESCGNLSDLLHGECISIGMLPVSSEKAKERIMAVLKKVSLPTEYTGNIGDALAYIAHDKKSSSDGISIVLCDEIGKFIFKTMSIDEFNSLILNYAK